MQQPKAIFCPFCLAHFYHPMELQNHFVHQHSEELAQLKKDKNKHFKRETCPCCDAEFLKVRISETSYIIFNTWYFSVRPWSSPSSSSPSSICLQPDVRQASTFSLPHSSQPSTPPRNPSSWKTFLLPAVWPKISEEVHQAPRSSPTAATPKEVFASDGQLLCQREKTWGDAGWLRIGNLSQI